MPFIVGKKVLIFSGFVELLIKIYFFSFKL